jgi:shikimate O-hydroxycinnamoyltransferase
MDTDDDGCRGIVNQVRDSISKVNMDYMKKLQESDELGHLNFIKEHAAQIRKGEVVSLSLLVQISHI